MVQNKKILLHACCGICSAYPIKYLIENNFNPIVYFTNSNLDTQEEFNNRFYAQKKLCDFFNIELILDKYDHNDYLNHIKGLECEPEKGLRCLKCIEYRLIKSYNKAFELGINSFTTSLIISPHKNFDLITKIANDITNDTEIEFLPINFRKKDGFLKTNKIANEMQLYRQNYCGCEFSKKT